MNQMLDGLETKPKAEASEQGKAAAPPAKPPQDRPALYLTGISFGGHTLAFGASEGRSFIPKNAVRLELFFAVTDGPGDAPLSKAQYWRSFVNSPIKIGVGPELDKKTATYYARWANEDGDVGPWSEPVSKTIAV